MSSAASVETTFMWQTLVILHLQSKRSWGLRRLNSRFSDSFFEYLLEVFEVGPQRNFWEPTPVWCQATLMNTTAPPWQRELRPMNSFSLLGVWGEREDLKRVGGNWGDENPVKRRNELNDVGLRYFEVQALSHPIQLYDPNQFHDPRFLVDSGNWDHEAFSGMFEDRPPPPTSKYIPSIKAIVPCQSALLMFACPAAFKKNWHYHIIPYPGRSLLLCPVRK